MKEIITHGASEWWIMRDGIHWQTGNSAYLGRAMLDAARRMKPDHDWKVREVAVQYAAVELDW